ncbi:MAG TPA: DUF4082 domain-containing protein [Pirellulales bacterium]|nr:DUF4082 domain-containing protein [Pirellulales bacterium]
MAPSLIDFGRWFTKRSVAKRKTGNSRRSGRRLRGGEPLEPRWMMAAKSVAMVPPEVWLPLDEGAGNVAADYSGNGRNATDFGATWAPGRVGTGLSFDGQSSYVNANLDLSRWLGGTAAMSFWMLTTQVGTAATATAPGIAGVHNPDSNNEIGWGWLDSTGHIHVGAGVTAASSHAVNDGRWHFITLARNATSGLEQVYVDGLLDGSAVGRTGGITSSFTSIGRIEHTSGGAAYFAGELDDIQIFSQVIAAAQVQQSFKQGPAAHAATPPAPAVSTDPWTQMENARINQIREGNAEVQVVDQFSNPVPNVTIDAREVQSQFAFGSAINNNVLVNPQYAAFFKSHFSWATMEDESNWYADEPTQGNVLYNVADGIAAYAAANNITLRGHSIVWGWNQIVQPWLKQLSPPALFQALEARVQSVVAHFDGTFAQWEVDNEMLNATFFSSRLTNWILPWLFEEARALDPDAQLFTNDTNAIEGNSTAAYKAEIQSLLAAGAPIDGIGVQAHFFGSINPRDVESKLNSLGQLGLPIWVTEFDTANADPNQRANQMEALYREAFSNPSVQGIVMWGFWAGSQWRGPTAAMVNLDWTLNADGQRYEDLMHQWTTIADGATNGAGNLDFRGFAGTYAVTVTGPDGSTTVQQFSVSPGAGTSRTTIVINVPASSIAADAIAAVQRSFSLWTDATLPHWTNTSDAQSVELGMKFQSDVDGFITGLRFYKSATNTGPHVADLWSADGALLATATFTNETASGWQQVNFSNPVAIKAHTTYIASYHTTNGNYADDIGFFANAGATNGPLHALSNVAGGGNGVYRYGPGGFPGLTARESNYWVDVAFTPNS